MRGIGELIVPIKFKKISVSKDGDLTEDYFMSEVGKTIACNQTKFIQIS